jgi:TPR repeat protein
MLVSDFPARTMNARLLLAALLLATPLPLAAQTAAPAAGPLPDDIETQTPDAPREDPALALYWQAQKLFRSKVPADLARGRALLEQAADGENSHAENYLGVCLQHGLHGFAKNTRKAANWYLLAAQRGNAYAQANLGLCQLYGTGVRKDREKARQSLAAATADDANYETLVPPDDFFDAPAVKDSPPGEATLSGQLPIPLADRYRAFAHFALGELNAQEKKEADAQAQFVKAATAGEGGRAGIRDAAIKAAINYAFGLGVPRDLSRANQMLEQSKKLTRQQAIAYVHGLVEEKRLDDFAQADFEEEVATKSDEAQQRIQFAIAGSFADPKSKDYNPQEAARWYELAAEGKDAAWAMLSLAFLHHDGSLGKKDPEQAFKWFKEASERGKHVLGSSNLAICYQHGLGTAKDTAKADELFKANREKSIVAHLGTLGRCPADILTYEQELALTKTWATKEKDPHACYLYGMRFLYGWGVKADIRDAESWLKRAAKSGHGPAWRELGNLYMGLGLAFGLNGKESLLKAHDCYQKAADANDADGIANLADLYAPPTPGENTTRTRFITPDEDKALALYERCLEIDPKNGRAHNNLAVIYGRRGFPSASRFQMLPDQEAIDKMLMHYKAAHEAGIATAALNLGNLYYEGALGEKDYQSAYTYFEAAANDGDIRARKRLAEMHERGEGVPVTYREAAYHYRLAAIGGDTDSLARLCTFYIQGKGVSQDYDRASMWLSMLAQRGRSGALVTLGDLMLRREQHAEALKFFKRLIGTRNDYLMGAGYDRLSRMYAGGLGVKADAGRSQNYHEKAVALGNASAIYTDALKLIAEKKFTEALPLVKKASANGSVDAEYQLSAMYYLGQGVPVDKTLAMKHCLSAADKGNHDAQISLCILALKGSPDAPDLEAAIRYAESAETGGHPKAGMIRKKLEEKRDKAVSTASENARSL